jgi:hypothetical protein
LSDRRVSRLQAVERALGRLTFGTVGREGDDLLPGLRGALEILLAECPDDTEVQQRLRVLRIDFQRLLELRERLVGLIRVVVTDAQIGADIDVIRLKLQCFAVPLDRVVVLFGVEVEILEFDSRLGVGCFPLRDCLERVHLCLVEYGRAR